MLLLLYKLACNLVMVVNMKTRWQWKRNLLRHTRRIARFQSSAGKNADLSVMMVDPGRKGISVSKGKDISHDNNGIKSAGQEGRSGVSG
jgi:hypothetical protein